MAERAEGKIEGTDRNLLNVEQLLPLSSKVALNQVDVAEIQRAMDLLAELTRGERELGDDAARIVRAGGQRLLEIASRLDGGSAIAAAKIEGPPTVPLGEREFETRLDILLARNQALLAQRRSTAPLSWDVLELQTLMRFRQISLPTTRTERSKFVETCNALMGALSVRRLR